METGSSERVGRLENRRERGHGVASSGRQVTRAHTLPCLDNHARPDMRTKRHRRMETKKTHRAETESAYLVANGSGARRWW